MARIKATIAAFDEARLTLAMPVQVLLKIRVDLCTERTRVAHVGCASPFPEGQRASVLVEFDRWNSVDSVEGRLRAAVNDMIGGLELLAVLVSQRYCRQLLVLIVLDYLTVAHVRVCVDFLS